MSDIVERLRKPLAIEYAVPFPVAETLQQAADNCGQAADEIERLRGALSLLKQALEAIDTGRSEPLFIMRDAIRNWLDSKAHASVNETGTNDRNT